MSETEFFGNVPDEKRCTATSRRSGERCNNARANGTRVCRMHGGSSPAAREKHARVQAQRAYERETQRYAECLDPDDPEAKPLSALDAEVRRTLGWVHYLEARVAELSEDELIFGLAALEVQQGVRRGGRIAVRTAQRRARPHPWVVLLEREREHLTQLLGIMIRHGVQAQRLALEEKQVDQMAQAIDAVVTALGRDPSRPDVRKAIRAALARLA